MTDQVRVIPYTPSPLPPSKVDLIVGIGEDKYTLEDAIEKAMKTIKESAREHKANLVHSVSITTTVKDDLYSVTIYGTAS